MCTILFSWKNHPRYSLILAANRDEFYARPTEAAHYWEDQPQVFAGRDLTGKGTWMGVTRQGRFAAITNFRDLDRIKADAPSRGKLVSDYLTGFESPEQYLNQITKKGTRYNPFNLLIGDGDNLLYYSNVNQEVTKLSPGVYGLSNGLLDESWHKVTKGKDTLEQIIKAGISDPADLLEFLHDKEQASDQELPNTGVSLELEKKLSALFIRFEGYGTRCSTVVLRDEQGIQFLEKTHQLQDQEEKLVKEKLSIT